MFWLAFSVCAVASAFPFLVTHRLPMTDLPQHAAQLTIWQHYHDACYGFDQQYELNWFTPYLIGYFIVRFFGLFLTLHAALKLTVFACILAIPLTMRMVTRRAGVDSWIALLGFPLAFGYSFHWGFLTTMVAVPIGIVFVCLAFDYAREQTVSRTIWLTMVATLLLLAHALIFVACMAAGAAVLVGHLRLPKRLALALIPFVLPSVILLLWQQHVSIDARVQVPTLWDVNVFRVWRFFSYLLSGVTKNTEALMGISFFLGTALLGLKPSRNLYRWAPAMVLCLLFFVVPMRLYSITFVYGRLAVLFAIFLVLGFEKRPMLMRPLLARGALMALVLGWLFVLTVRSASFGTESQDFDRLIDQIPTNRKVLFLTYDRESEAVPGTPYLQWGAYYQVRKGGLISWSFANNFQMVVRYFPGVEMKTTKGLYLDPRRFKWGTTDSEYEFFVARANYDPGGELFRSTSEPVKLIAQIGMWWLYRRASVSMAPGPCLELAPGGSE
jgi:hypothetical protein